MEQGKESCAPQLPHTRVGSEPWGKGPRTWRTVLRAPPSHDGCDKGHRWGLKGPSHPGKRGQGARTAGGAPSTHHVSPESRSPAVACIDAPHGRAGWHNGVRIHSLAPTPARRAEPHHALRSPGAEPTWNCARSVQQWSRTADAWATCCPQRGFAAAWPDPSPCPRWELSRAHLRSRQPGRSHPAGLAEGSGMRRPRQAEVRATPGTVRALTAKECF